ncbi:hypothetical protein G6F46_005198 [Rhizopus delemar]|uniref:Uncharacterized protein n=3 Tax=Rhizopus TaxID=4842 RepID=I1BVR9_RHIO9|nr:hypothetical protein RO3G_05004 [Rhizopus delemar RA 99-880]KAG1461199.1 hypothetical protein G6F55_003699 [Rhizopus delemar]KAG1545484.1 hypothetical protein G6F51_005444 [Rhizopus arrhizus]KAG1499266.1 hypothetical protein G6F54_004523 [Rhizopus delemar]KAG1512985.1 hypothetical protein G6F53_004775 [Rhizopus delemar]|eukprot:EIE80299.1 hypothetical protein RO3G_05004 [Rhizopus delemar RA 99-880]
MTRLERDRCLRWSLGGLPEGKPKPCPYHRSHLSTKQHSIRRLNVRLRLQMPLSVLGPLSFLLNQLSKKPLLSPQKAVAWRVRWLVIYTLLHELDYLAYKETTTIPLEPGAQHLKWLSQNWFQVLQVLSITFSLIHFYLYAQKVF